MAKRGPKGPNSSTFKKGQSGNPNGRPPGVPNKVTTDFRASVTNLLNDCGPQLMEWVQRVAKKNPQRAVDCLAALAEYAVPKQSRVTVVGDSDAPILYKEVVDNIPNEPEITKDAGAT